MKILLIGDASNYHRTLAKGLLRLGHDVTVASDGSKWMQTQRDIDLHRGKSSICGALHWLKLRTVLSGKLKGYDVVQISNPVFLHLKPHRVKRIFDSLRRNNGAVFLSALGTDTPYVDFNVSPDFPLRYNEFLTDGKDTDITAENRAKIKAWQSEPLRGFCKHVYANIDGAVSALYEYDLACRSVMPPDKVFYGGIPVDLEEIPFRPANPDGAVRIMLACHKGREAEKGADRLLPVLRRLEKDFPGRVVVDLVQDKPFAEFAASLDEAHIIIDQLYSYTPATTALMAMASGKITVSGGEKEYYDFIGEKELRPIVNADPLDLDGLYDRLAQLVQNTGEIVTLARQGREFVRKHNSAEVVAKRFLRAWETALGQENANEGPTSETDNSEALLTVMICTHGSDGLNRVAAMRLPQIPSIEYLVSCQSEESEIPREIDREDINVVFSDTRGLSNNRNAAMAEVKTPWALVADDDLVYSTEGLQTLLDALRGRNDIDLATVRVKRPGKSVYPSGYYDFTTKCAGYSPVSVEILVRMEAVREKGLRFSPLFGIGAPFLGCGEEDLLLINAKRSGMRMLHLPITIAEHPGETTSLRKKGEPAILRAAGAVIWLRYGLSAWPRMLLQAKREGGNPLGHLKHILQGARYAARHRGELEI